MTKRKLSFEELREILSEAASRYNRKAFIENDPISIPHRYASLQDREIAGLFAATLAWGQRKSIIRSCERLMSAMDDAPYQFVMGYTPNDLTSLEKFVHRTFQYTDLKHFLRFLRHHYQQSPSLEALFAPGVESGNTETGLIRFHNAVFSLKGSPQRTRKHVATPERGSACKRLNMYLRWMVRSDSMGVDFGVWKTIRADQLVCPVDVHVRRTAVSLGLMKPVTLNWKAAVALTKRLKEFDPIDPVRFDFALFGLGLDVRH